MMQGNAPLSPITGVPGWETEQEQVRLMELAGLVPSNGLIVEIGGEFGQSASLFLRGGTAGNVRVVTIDLFPGNLLDIHRSNLKESGLDSSSQIKGDSHKDVSFEDVIKVTGVQNNKKIDLLFVDGDHTYEGVLADLYGWAEHVKKGGYMVLHDCACATNTMPHALHFEVTRALTEWFNDGNAKDWQALDSVDSLMVFQKVK